jgi:beta-glucosidase
MVSLHTWEGEKLHADKYLLTDVLKTEMQFQGFVVSDWDGVKSLGPDYHANIVASINAGMDMVMLSGEPEVFIAELTQAVEQHEVSMSRIDDAVTRILSVKLQSGAFDGYAESTDVRVIGSAQHRELAREAVRESAVLLKNQDNLLPLHKDTQRIFVAGSGADDIGQQSGGWTIFWQGGTGEITKGTTILQAIQNTVAPETKVEYRADGKFKHKAEVAIVVVGEAPYAEGRGDAADLHLSHTDLEVIRAAKEHAEKVVVVLLSGRPMIVSEEINDWDAFVMAWLPGSEAQGLADVLFGDYPFTGKLPFTWSSQMTDLPITDDSKSLAAWPMGFGLTTGLSLAHQPICKPQSELSRD